MKNQLNSKGQKTGLWVDKNLRGKITLETNYINGVKDGIEISYYTSYKRKQYIDKYKNGKLHGASVSFFNKAGSPIESKGEYLNGKKHGKWLQKHDDFFRHNEGTYVNGEKHGHWIEQNPGGYNFKGFYCNDKKEGAWVSISYSLDLPNKSPIYNIEYYKEGKLDFVSISFHENGKVSSFKEYQEGKSHGKFYTNSNDGSRYEGGNYQNDKKEGEWIEYIFDGKFVKRNYKNGKQI